MLEAISNTTPHATVCGATVDGTVLRVMLRWSSPSNPVGDSDGEAKVVLSIGCVVGQIAVKEACLEDAHAEVMDEREVESASQLVGNDVG